MTNTRIDASWLKDAHVQRLLAILNADGEEARVVGGAVRNHLLDQTVSDVDIATTCLPAETMERAKAAGFKAVPTGIDHGTATIVADGHGFEVTTLRRDVETHGRHATVAFGRDWAEDAERRDFTINALYCDADGTIFDPVGGLADIKTRTVRFIGDAETRIREDYLRILRFFRFFAWYGDGRPDAKGLMACTRLKDGLDGLSAERIWAEMHKLLSAPDPSRTMLWMRQTGVLTRLLPESEKWGIDAIGGLIAAEAAFSWHADPMLRLMAVIPPRTATVTQLAERWKVSNAQRDRMLAWAAAPEISAGISERKLAAQMYRQGATAILDRLKLALVTARMKAETGVAALEDSAALVRLLRFAEGWRKPDFPLAGRDMIAEGHEPGPAMGALLRDLEEEWIESGFNLDRDQLLQRMKERS